MKTKTNKLIVIGLLVLLLTTVLLLFYFRGIERETPDHKQPILNEQDRPIQNPSDPPTSDTIPNLMAGEDSDTPFAIVAADEFSPTIMHKEEVMQEVANTLDGLMRLDPEAIDRVSLRSTGGDHNPFRYMLQAAFENKDIGDAFIHLASASKYEILGCDVSDDAPNHFTFYLSCSTPYASDLIPVLAAGPNPKYIQEVSSFAGTGAAVELANTDLKELPLSNDIVILTVVVENDVPMIYHPVSLNYGNRRPQYAFLWGGAVFCGILDGDLLIENKLGHSFEVEKDKFLSVKSNAEVYDFIETALDALKKNDMDAIARLKLRDTEMGASSFFSNIVPGFAEINERFPGTLGNLNKRTASLEYSCRFFGFKRSDEDYIPYNTLLITCSVIEPDSIGRVYFHQLISWDSLSEMDRTVIIDGVSNILTTALGGDQLMLLHRLNMGDLLREVE